jgi:hypothetical protein
MVSGVTGVSVARAFGSNRGDVHHLAALGDEEEAAWNLAGGDAGLDVGLGLGEDGGVEAQRGGISRHLERGHGGVGYGWGGRDGLCRLCRFRRAGG